MKITNDQTFRNCMNIIWRIKDQYKNVFVYYHYHLHLHVNFNSLTWCIEPIYTRYLVYSALPNQPCQEYCNIFQKSGVGIFYMSHFHIFICYNWTVFVCYIAHF